MPTKYGKNYPFALAIVLSATFLLITPESASAQGRGKGNPTPSTPSIVSVILSQAARAEIREFYSSRPATGAEALPPGIRRRLARGKPLPPGIAKQFAPSGLRSRIELPDGYEIVEVGLDVVLVEAATNVVRDVLRDVVR